MTSTHSQQMYYSASPDRDRGASNAAVALEDEHFTDGDCSMIQPLQDPPPSMMNNQQLLQ